jgi:hypothetical protein
MMENDMNIDDIPYGEPKKIAGMFTQNSAPATSAYKVGEQRMFRTVTHIITGRIVSIHHDGIVVTDAAWVADTGRYANAILSGEFSEVEPYPDGMHVVVNHAAMIDAPLLAKLPRVQK